MWDNMRRRREDITKFSRLAGDMLCLASIVRICYSRSANIPELFLMTERLKADALITGSHTDGLLLIATLRNASSDDLILLRDTLNSVSVQSQAAYELAMAINEAIARS